MDIRRMSWLGSLNEIDIFWYAGFNSKQNFGSICNKAICLAGELRDKNVY